MQNANAEMQNADTQNGETQNAIKLTWILECKFKTQSKCNRMQNAGMQNAIKREMHKT